jgi:hypothetical protein
VNDKPLPLRILELRAQIAELSGTIRQLQRSGLDDALRLLISRKRAELEDLTRRSRRQDDLSSAPAVQENDRLIAPD